MFVAGIVFSACDPGIYDLPGAGDNLFDGIEIKQFLDPKVCYDQLLEDLEFMKSTCYSDEKLAAMQAYTILTSYSFADAAKESSSFTPEQLKTKAALFAAIKLINIYSNNYVEGVISLFDPEAILVNTDTAIAYCSQILTYL